MSAKTPTHPLDLVIQRGLRIGRPTFTLFGKTTPANYQPRIVISQKIDKRATVRNRLRRQIKSVLTPFLRPRVGLVVVCRPEIVKLSFAQLKKELEMALNRLPWSKLSLD